MVRALAAGILFAAIAAPGPAQTRPIFVTVANRAVQTPAIVRSGQVLLPLRDTFEALNSSVSYDRANNVITAHNILHRVRLRVGSRTAFIDRRAVHLEVPARFVNGRIYVPLRFAAQAMGAIVLYDPRTRTVAVNGSPPNRQQPIDAAHPPQELNPPPNSNVVTAYPIVSASLGTAVAASNAVTLAIDGSDVTPQSAFDGRTITFVPKSGLPQGRHTASFSGHTASGQPFSTQWSFVTSEPAMPEAAYSYGDYRFFAEPLEPIGSTSSLMNLTLVAPPTGSGFVQFCTPNLVYPLWNGGTQWYRARIVVPRPFIAGSCPINAIFVGPNGRRIVVPITPMNGGLYLTGSPLNPIGQYQSAPVVVPVFPPRN